jgi:hypothetical protein
LHDPEFGGKLYDLRAHLAQLPPGRSFVLVLGSSHTGMGIRPGVLLPAPCSSAAAALLYNFSINRHYPE